MIPPETCQSRWFSYCVYCCFNDEARIQLRICLLTL